MPTAIVTGSAVAEPDGAGRLDRLIACAVPAALIVGLSFRSGGYPAGIPATAAVLLGILLAVRLLLAPGSVCRPAGWGLAAVAALAALTAWTFGSAAWSHAPADAIGEGCRSLLYLAMVATLATLPGRPLPSALRGVALGAVAVAVAALATRVAPDLFPIGVVNAQARLSYPLSYQNALGILTATGLLLCLHLTCEPRESPRTQVAAATAVPALVVVLYLTQSRGAIGCAVLGIAGWLVLARPPAALGALAALALPTALALGVAYRAVVLISFAWNTPGAIPQGHALGLTVLVASAAAAYLRRRSLGWRPQVRAPARLRPSRAVVAIAVAIVVAAGVAVDAPGRLRSLGTEFVHDAPSRPAADPRARLTQVFNGGRIGLWRVALEAWRTRPLLGVGAGGFDEAWSRFKPDYTELTEAHSLYVETLSELGVVGLVLLLAALGGLAAACLTAPATRAARAAVAAVALMWLLQAAIDWNWELPATAAGLFCLAGAASRRTPAAARRSAPAVARPSPPAAALAPRLALAGALLVACAPVAAWAAGQAQSDRALDAYAAGDCASARAQAERALTLLPWRPDAHAVRAACLARSGRASEARAAAARAAGLAPGDWRYRYDQALVLAATGERSLAQASESYRLGPRSVETFWIRYWLTPGRPRAPRRTAALAPLMLAGDRYPPVLAGRSEPRS